MELLDRIDPARHDTEAIAEAATRFYDLGQSERAEYMGARDYADLDEAQHPLAVLLRESHNDTGVVRDLDGSLQLLWEAEPRSGKWLSGPLCRENLISDGEINDLLESDPDWLGDSELGLSRDELVHLLDSLPSSPGPVMSF